MPDDEHEQEQQDESLGGLAKRWLKTQFRWSGGDPMQGRRDREEADRIERQMRNRVKQQRDDAIVDTLLPGFRQRQAEAERQRKAESERRAREALERTPRGRVQLTLAGAIEGTIDAEMAVTVTRPEEPGEALAVYAQPLAPVEVGGHPFVDLTFSVPRFAGPGPYDLSILAANLGDGFDASQFQLVMDEGSYFYWIPDYGPGRADVDVDGRTIRFELVMEDEASRRVQLGGMLTLP